MILIICLQLLIVICLVRASRRRLEDALPVLCFFLVLMPLEARLVIPGLFDINTSRVCLLTLLILYARRHRPATQLRIPMKGWILLHVGWAICSTLYSISMMTSVKQVVAQVLEFYLLYYLLLRIITDTQTIFKMLYAMVMALAVCSLIGTLEAYASWSILRIFPADLWTTYNGGLDPLYSEMGRGIRIRATFPHPILFGVALSMAIPMALYLLGMWKVKWQRTLLWIALPLMVWAIYKTSSRGPWIVVAGSCIMLVLLLRGRVRRYVATIGALLLIVAISRPGIWQTIEDMYEATHDPSSPVGSSYQYRYALMDAITAAVAKSPERLSFGYGLGTFREKGLQINFLGMQKRWFTCDNNWAAFLYETGYGGLLILGGLLFTPLFMAARSYYRLPRSQREFSGVMFILLAGFYISMISVASYSWGQQGSMAWILISTSVIYPQLVLQEHRSWKKTSPREGLLVVEAYVESLV